MERFRRRGTAVMARLAAGETAVLGTLAGEFVQLVQPLCNQDGEWLPDPALNRLFPDAYRDDMQASAEFRRFTQPDQATAKAEAARAVIADIQDADDGWVTVPPDHVTAWLTTLTNLRLVLATRLDIATEDDVARLADLPRRDKRAPTVAVLDWCGWMLESLLDAVASA